MRLGKRRATPLPELNMTPMIDVVFQLLIFFMLVPHMTRVNKELLELPKLSGTEDQQESSLTVNITRDGQIIVTNEPRTVAGVVEMVSGEISRFGGDRSRVKVLVRADQRGTSRMVNQVVSALAKLGVRQIRVGVEVPK
jgi:biopolymer transport protein ExbD